MKKAIKAVFILLVALIVLTGGLMIAEGVKNHLYGEAAIAVISGTQPETNPLDNKEGSAI